MTHVPRKAASALIVLLGLRVLWLFWLYSTGRPGTERHHVESAVVLFAIAGLVLRCAQSDPSARQAALQPSAHAWEWSAYCVAALGLYLPAVFTGFLSDDFALVARASAWDLSPVSAVLFRPVPLFAWAVLGQLGFGAVAFHVFNVLVHGTNAYLSALVLEHAGTPRLWGLVGGLMLLTMPLAVEPVVWCAGVFDVVAATFVLSAVLVSFRYGDQATPVGTRLLFGVFGVAAVLSKETAVVTPFLVLVIAGVRQKVPRTLQLDIAVAIVAFALFGFARLLASPPTGPAAPTKYIVQRALFSAFGSLAVPYHTDVSRAVWMPFAAVAALATLTLVFFLLRGSRRDFWTVVRAVLWVIVSIAPVYPVLVIPPDLQQSRYLYLASAGWALFFVTQSASVSAGRAAIRGVAWCAIGVVLLLNTIATVRTERHWVEAGQLRDSIERAAANDARMRSCETIALTNLPDSIRGAYVFRNGVREAFARDLGLQVADAADDPGCSFVWSDRQNGFVQRAMP